MVKGTPVEMDPTRPIELRQEQDSLRTFMRQNEQRMADLLREGRRAAASQGGVAPP